MGTRIFDQRHFGFCLSFLQDSAVSLPFKNQEHFSKDCSRRGAIILDPFGGSGTTLITAQKSGRLARLIEYDPRYCDVIIRRFEAVTGASAILAQTGHI